MMGNGLLDDPHKEVLGGDALQSSVSRLTSSVSRLIRLDVNCLPITIKAEALPGRGRQSLGLVMALKSSTRYSAESFLGSCHLGTTLFTTLRRIRGDISVADRPLAGVTLRRRCLAFCSKGSCWVKERAGGGVGIVYVLTLG